MTLHVGASSGSKTAIAMHVGTASGTKAVAEGWIGTAGGNRRFYSAAAPLTVTASPSSLTWQVISHGAFYVTDSAATATPSGGTPPYAFLWQTDNGSATADDSAAATTTFHSSDGHFATATCMVTDANGDSADSNPVSIS